jgi:hypothetical protein
MNFIFVLKVTIIQYYTFFNIYRNLLTRNSKISTQKLSFLVTITITLTIIKLEMLQFMKQQRDFKITMM